MVGRFARMEPSLGRTVHVQYVGQDLPLGIDDADAQCVGGAFDA